MGEYVDITSIDTVALETPLGRMRAVWYKAPESKSVDDAIDSDYDRGIVKCLNIPYADIPFRWAAPQRIVAPWQGVRDCTVFGPGCPQYERPLFDMEDIPLFGRPGPSAFPIVPERVDEFACLNLNVYAPATRSPDGSRVQFVSPSHNLLPVLVWVHGGSYTVGSGCVDVYDGSQLVWLSMKMKIPMIVVTINYRLGVLGFLHSEQLQNDAAKRSEGRAVSTGNLGLLDTKCSFEWIKENIQHFGGDRDNITSIGESAGAGCNQGIIHYLSIVPRLYIRIPRMILSSSTCLSIQLLRSHEAQVGFDAICRNVQIQPSDSDVVDQLRGIPVDKLIAGSQVASSIFRPVWDDIVITDDPRRIMFHPELWDPCLHSIILGTCQNEAWLREVSSPRPTHDDDLNRKILSRIPAQPIELRQRARRLYTDPGMFPWFTTQKTPSTSAQNCSLAFEGHGRYYIPAALFSQSFVRRSTEAENERRMYRYMFGYVTDHWKTPSAARTSPSALQPATHTADILPMFLHASLSKEDRKVSEAFASFLVEFVSGKQQENNAISRWQPYTVGEKYINSLDRKGKWSVVREGPDVFDLTEEYLRLWSDVSKAIIATGRSGWPGMAR